ncbi:hypothetical protein PYW08_009683 [Mythimna loreyi]|uniref:Uncharacterized protein n=1 Tax=Mythimna loreyi TaxID=667449 RepID=A0ACC2Q7G1_9NEOP|nr:hypothetical protein PYW08_009683 [Mythimna loreyi]
MSANVTLLLIFVTLASVTAQTFQYSRGWTNGKRDGHVRTYGPEMKELINSLDKILSPCQKNKLKYLLEGKPVPERMLLPCDILDTEDSPRALTERNLNSLMDVYY